MRQPKPYYKRSHAAWYVNFAGKPVRLADNEKEAWEEYHRLMAGEAPVTSKTTVEALIDQFLWWTKNNRAPRTYEWYLLHLNSFTKHVGPKLTVAQVKPMHVSRWLEHCYKSSGDSNKNGACQTICRAFNWAKRQGLIATSPMAGLEKPPREPREAYLSPENWDKLISAIPEHDTFAELLWFMRETGCRPLEARVAEAKHWDRAGERLVLTLALTKGKKGKKMARIIRLNGHASAIIGRASLKYPEGPLFRNRRGRAWTANSVNCRFFDLRKALGFEAFPYILRHSWCTDALLRGVDPLTVALLMGHTDASMVMKVYNHLIHQNDFLKNKLRQATGESTATGSGDSDQPPPASIIS